MDLSRYIKTEDASELVAERRLNIVFASAELAPFSKTGGLADVAASLPTALAQRGHNVVVFTPLYPHLDPEKMQLSRRLRPLQVPRKSKNQSKVQARLWETRLQHGVRVFFVEQNELFDEHGPYRYEDSARKDNADRFAFFSRSVVEFVRSYPLPVDVMHLNDWHTGLAPLYAKHYFEEQFQQIVTVQTIHNLAYQGTFDPEHFDDTGLPQKYADPSELFDSDGQLNFLKGAIQYADRITTVSPGYAGEIQTEERGEGLDQLLTERADDLQGILNGVDYNVWSPDADRHIEVQYDIDSLNGKRQNKADLQHRMDLPIRPTLPLVGVISRLTRQKGIDVLTSAVRTLLDDASDDRDGFQLVVLGEGDDEFRRALQELQQDFPRRVACRFAHSEELAHRIQAGADILAVPSRYEPCGLTQIYAMRYGTVPVVHATGGLADSVSDLRDDPDSGTGFVFEPLTEQALAGALDRAASAYRNYRKWRPLMVRAMRRDFSWEQSARQYESLFLSMQRQMAAE